MPCGKRVSTKQNLTGDLLSLLEAVYRFTYCELVRAYQGRAAYVDRYSFSKMKELRKQDEYTDSVIWECENFFLSDPYGTGADGMYIIEQAKKEAGLED